MSGRTRGSAPTAAARLLSVSCLGCIAPTTGALHLLFNRACRPAAGLDGWRLALPGGGKMRLIS